MGDRANIKIKQHSGKKQDENIYVYGHWMGYYMPQKLQDALKFAEGRWTDESYLTRCIITEVAKDARDNTGYGVSTYRTDNERDVLEVDSDEQKVRLLDEAGWDDEEFDWEGKGRKVKGEWTFAEYCALPMAEADDAWECLKQKPVPA